tara:strand:- start:77 stop:481 length:405 start_codon:yes stop_codon:yes gene_type:complete
MVKAGNTLSTRSHALVAEPRQNATKKVRVIAATNVTGNTTKKVTPTKRENEMKLDAKQYKRDGYIKIDSTRLKMKFYLIKNLQVKVPDDDLLRVTQRSLKTLEGLTPDERQQLFQTAEIFCKNVYDAQFASSKK